MINEEEYTKFLGLSLYNTLNWKEYVNILIYKHSSTHCQSDLSQITVIRKLQN